MEPQQTNPSDANTANWPDGVTKISYGNIGRLGVGKDDKLYWDGKPVQLEQRLTLSALQRFWAIVLATATFFAALGSVTQGWTAYNDWACRVGWSAICRTDAKELVR